MNIYQKIKELTHTSWFPFWFNGASHFSSDLSAHLDRFQGDLPSVHSLEGLINLLSKTFLHSLNVDYSVLFFYHTASQRFSGYNTSNQAQLQIEFTSDSPFIQLLSKKRKAVIFFGEETIPRLSEGDRAKLTILELAVCSPIIFNDRLIGFIGLGIPQQKSFYEKEQVNFLEEICRQLSIPLNYMLEKSETNQKLRQMDSLIRLSQGINITLHFDDLLELIFAQTANIIPLTDYWLTVVDEKTQKFKHLIYIENSERRFDKENKPILPENCLEKETILTQKPLLTEDYLHSARLAGINPGKTEIQSWMSVPLISGARTIGAICVGHRSLDVHYNDQHQSLLQAIADQTAAAITKTNLLIETQTHANRLTILNEITRSLTATLEINPLLDIIRTSGQKLLPCEEWIVWVYDESSEELTQQFSTQHQDFQLNTVALGLIQQTLNERNPIIKNSEIGSEDQSNYLVFPLLIENRRIGIIALINKKDNLPFDAEDLEIISTFGNQVAIALDNALKYAQTDQALQDRLKELSALQRIDQELNATLDIARTLELTLQWAIQYSGADAGFIGLVNQSEFQPYHIQGYPSELSLNDFSGCLQLIPNHQKIYQGSDKLYLPNGKATVMLPIEREGNVIAMIFLESINASFCPPDILNFLTRLCTHAAIALSNAILYSEVQQANLAKSEFVSLVSHELKTPMTAIKGYADLIAQGAVGPINEIQTNFLTTIRANVNRMATLVSDLADVSRIEAGKLQLQYEAVSISEVLQEVIRTLTTQVEEKSQTIITAIPDDLPKVWCDRNRLIQIYNNLISNAVKYSPPNSTINVHCSETNNPNSSSVFTRLVLTSVTDQGYGIAEKDREKIFQKFFRSEDPHIRENPGTGLGLNITKHLVEIQGGEIWFESQQGAGTTFYFTIPTASLEE